MGKQKLCKAEIEYKLQNYLTNELGVQDDYYVKVSKKKSSSKLGSLPETRPFGIDIELAHKIYNWAHWKKVKSHKAINHFLIATGGDVLDLAPERPKDADNFAMRYHKAKGNTKPKRRNNDKQNDDLRTLRKRLRSSRY